MKSRNEKLKRQKEDLCLSLEEQLQLLYNLRTSIRTSSRRNPRSMGEVLHTWTEIHHQHQQLKDLLKTYLYVPSSPVQ